MKSGIKKQVIQVGLLILITAAVFANTLFIDFLWDDQGIVKRNQYIQSCKNIPLFFTPFYSNKLHPLLGQYRPIRTVSLAVDYCLWRENPVGYHLTNLLLHLANISLIYLLVTLIPRENKIDNRDGPALKNFFPGLAFVTALLFALHPIHTESVNLIKNRSDLMALLFSLFVLLFFIHSFSPARRPIRLVFSLGAWFCFVLAILSKEASLVLPGVMVLYVFCFQKPPSRKRVAIKIIPYVITMLVYGWFRYLYIRSAESHLAGFAVPENLSQHILAVIKTVGQYVKMMMIPFPLNVDHDFTIPASVWAPELLVMIITLLLICVLTVAAYRYDRIFFFAIGWMFLTLLPVSNIIYLESRPIAEQRLYLPSLGFCLMLGYGFERLFTTRHGMMKSLRSLIIIGALMIMTVSLYAAGTVRRNFDWCDTVLFYSRNIAVNPNSSRMHNNLAVAYSSKGNFKDAFINYKISLRLKPDNLNTLLNMGLLLSENGRLEEAVMYYHQLLRLQPDHEKALNNLGFTYYKMGRIDDAFSHLRHAVQVNPSNKKSYVNLGFLMVDIGRFEEAAKYFLAALKIQPDRETYEKFMEAVREIGDEDTATRYYSAVSDYYP